MKLFVVTVAILLAFLVVLNIYADSKISEKRKCAENKDLRQIVDWLIHYVEDEQYKQVDRAYDFEYKDVIRKAKKMGIK